MVLKKLEQSLKTVLKYPKNIKKQVQKLAPKRETRHTRSNPDPNPPAIFENPNTIPKVIRKQREQETLADSSPETAHPNPVPTPIKVLFRCTLGSPSSPSTSQSPPFTPPSTAHIPLTNTLVSTVPTTPIVPVVHVIPVIPVNPI